MLAGALIAGATDLTYSLPGYIWVTICAVSTAMYLLLIRALKDSTGSVARQMAMLLSQTGTLPVYLILSVSFPAHIAGICSCL